MIAEAARAAGARVVLLAHTADDVAEADWMRARGSTLGRVRDWSPSPVWPEGRGLMLSRPLLDERREMLREYLTGRGIDWIEDPANADERFGRSRARAALSARGGERAGEVDGVALPTRSSLRFDHPPHEGEGEAGALAWAGVLEVSREASASALAAALLCAGGGSVPPRGERLAGLKARLAAGEDFVAGLSGARVEAAGATVRLMREPGEMRRRPPAPVRLTPGVAAVWDGRFEITTAQAGWRVEAAAGRLARLSEGERRVLATLPAAARGGVPVLVRDAGDGPILAWRGAHLRALGAGRLALALGETTQEADLFHPVHGETPPTDLFSWKDC
jgi:tRNA(Ile)-lysidine synthase